MMVIDDPKMKHIFSLTRFWAFDGMRDAGIRDF